MKGRSATRIALAAALLSPALSLAGQTVRLVNPSTMQFTDGVYGISFSFPASWTFSEQSSFFIPPSIFTAPVSDAGGEQVRGSVSTARVAGIRPFPATSLLGIEFSYAVRDQTTPEDCKYLAAVVNDEHQLVEEVSVHGVMFHHGSGGGAATGHGISENIYTLPYGTGCLLFDLGVQFANHGADDQAPRGLTRAENALVDRQLKAVFDSLEIAGTTVPSGFPVVGSTHPFADAQHGVRFDYPSSWTLSTSQQFYGPEAILNPPDDQHPAAGAIAIAATNDRVFADLHSNTNFNGASFLFNVQPAASESACLDNLHHIAEFDRLETRLVDGVAFRFLTTGRAGLCHQVSESIYVHQSSGSCILFDLAIHTTCSDVDRRQLNPDEIRQIRLQLQTILATVHLTGSARAASTNPGP